MADDKREKNWKHMYLRSAKLARARQLGLEYPRAPGDESLAQELEPSGDRLNVLFVCSRNQWRSPTAERVWRSSPVLSVRSAGTSPNAKRHVSEADLRWAETIFVMEEKHKARLLAEWGRVVEHKPIHVLDIPDEYKFMDPELVEELKRSVGGILGIE